MAETRTRVSKWDMVAETNFPLESRQENVQAAIALETSGDESRKEIKSLEVADLEFSVYPSSGGNNKYSNMSNLEATNAATLKAGKEESRFSKWSDVETGSKDYPKESNLEAVAQGDDTSRERSGWGAIQGQCSNQRMPHNIDARHQQNRDVSPKGGWNRSCRSQGRSRSRSRSSSRSISCSRSRSRSRSRDLDRESRDRCTDRDWGRNRSRSRSPVHCYRRSAEGRDEKRWAGSGAQCRDFMAGMCKRGGQCRYLHEDGGRKFSSRQNDAMEFGEGRQSPRHYSKDNTSDTMGLRDYSQDKAPHVHASQYGGQWQKPEPYRSGKDSAPCHDFKRGRCQRGSACRYAHHDASFDGGWDVKGHTRDRLRDGGDASAFFGAQRRQESHRFSLPCKFFAEGRCRNGDKCRFSHQDAVLNQPEKTSEFQSVQNSESENRLTWNGPTWDNRAGSMAAANASGWERDDNSSKASAYANVGQDSTLDLHDHQLEYAVDDNKYMALAKDVSHTSFPAQVQSSSQETASQQDQYVSTLSAQPMIQNSNTQQHTGVDRSNGSPHEHDGIAINTSTSKNEATMVPQEDETISINSSISQNETDFFANNLPAKPAMTVQSSNQIGQSPYLIPQSSNVQSFNLAGQSQQLATPALFTGQSQQQLVPPPTNGQTQFMVPQTAPNSQGVNISCQSHQTTPFNGQTQQTSHSLSSGHGQFILQPPQNANMNMEKQSQQNPPQPLNLVNQTQTSHDGQLRRADNMEITTSQTTAATVTQRVVTSEQVTQLSNLSASLAQIFGSGPQLPQLYAALNPYPSGVVPPTFPHPSSTGSLASTTLTHVQQNQGSWTQQQPGLASASTELGKADTSNMPPGFSSDPSEHNSMIMKESQASSSTIIPASSTDGPTKNVNLENHHEAKLADINGESKDLKGTVAGLRNNEQQTSHSEDKDANVLADEASKKNKDSKGTRMFRFALVEFVKDVLRPTWKDGQMSKEVHKTIVKKVVDKVTGTLDTNIPCTQERIDLYLSYSKEKLTKLVQAYMEKYLKT